LMVNGLDMTVLTPVTKYMVHLPLAFHKGKPESALIILLRHGHDVSFGVELER